MKEYFVPYTGDKPASVLINGHRLVIVSQDRDELQSHLNVLGGDCLKEVIASGSREDEMQGLEDLAEEGEGGVVIAPSDVTLDDVIRNLESELPWIQ